MSVLTPLDSTHHEVFLEIFFDFSKFWIRLVKTNRRYWFGPVIPVTAVHLPFQHFELRTSIFRKFLWFFKNFLALFGSWENLTFQWTPVEHFRLFVVNIILPWPD
jgi:hypothetical protein